VTALAEVLPAQASRPWKRALLWLGFLAPFFYLTYGGANWLAANRGEVGSFVFGWEAHIPFLAWTIVPYWSINALYGLSFFLCATREELDTLGKRLLTAQIVAVACFVLLPLRFTFERPEGVGGFSGFLFDALASFDKPFNQAPSLHIALLVILWDLYARHAPRRLLWPLHAWFALIGASVLTTYQHHFIDIPTGALLGFVCLWLWPDAGRSPLAGARPCREPKRRVLALRYAAGAAALALAALMFGGWALVLLWPALSLGLVAANYFGLGHDGFQKGPDGRMSLAARALFGPYLIGAFVNSRLWTRRNPAPAEVADGVWIGRIPSKRDAGRTGFASVVDLCAELPRADCGRRYHALPVLDLTAPGADTLATAAETIERARTFGPVLVCCALGYSRSAAAIATWGLRTGRYASLDAAIASLRSVRPRIILDEAARAAILAAAKP
jgi:membrane-associated phospholipid phosphatase